ncbi:hypothetical protein CYLTODRAFT_362973, partial [Cylindrobasidium torrendii FP15055 ss-10]
MNIQVSLAESEINKWLKGYELDAHFKDFQESSKLDTYHQSPKYPQYFYGEFGMIYFEDANGNFRLCVPDALRAEVMTQVHDSLMETAHAG